MTKRELMAIYRDAAQEMDLAGMCCGFAVCRWGERRKFPVWWEARRMYARVLQEDFRWAWGVDSEPIPKQVRVLLLLLMAEWVRTDWNGEL